MTFLLKDPDALLGYSVDWGAEYLTEDVIAASSWSVSPVEDGGLSVAASEADYKIATVQVAGGVPGRLYRLTNRIVTASGLEDRRSIVLRVEKR